MTVDRVAPHQGMMRQIAEAALLVTGLLLAGCTNPEAGAGSRLRVYAADLAGGAKVCEVPKIVPLAGKSSEVPMKLANDRGWCGIRVQQNGSKPFEAGLLTVRPKHGIVFIHEVGDETRIDFTPDRGFAGSDGFTVKLIPGNATLRTAVTVTLPSR